MTAFETVYPDASALLAELRAHGVRLALDDKGRMLVWAAYGRPLSGKHWWGLCAYDEQIRAAILSGSPELLTDD